MSKIKVSSTNFENKQNLKDCCLEIDSMNLINRQWTLAICCALGKARLRYGSIQKKIPNITERMLTLELRKMHKDGLVNRIEYSEVPLRVEYELTEIAKDLIPIIDHIRIWGEKHKRSAR